MSSAAHAFRGVEPRTGAMGEGRLDVIRGVVAILLSLILPPGLEAQSAVGLHVATAAERADISGRWTGFAHVRSAEGGSFGAWGWTVEGEVWLDLVEVSPLVALDATVHRSWSWGELRLGLDTPDWGLSRLRSPASMVAPNAILWSLIDGPPLAEPVVRLTGWTGTWDVELLLLPVRRPFHMGRLVERSWAGIPVEPSTTWELEAGYGARVRRTFATMDATLWWLHASDRRPWVDRSDSDVQVRHPRTGQLGTGVEWVVGEAVLRAEGSVAWRVGSRHTRAIVGVEWQATPYLSLRFDQGVASDGDEAASPLVDDALVRGTLLSETVRVSGGVAWDPVAGTLHGWSGMRWIRGVTWALEAEWVDAGGEAVKESEGTLRQPRVFRLGVVWYP